MTSRKGPPGGSDVGYGRPPREHQFQRGRSGNPKGRPKGSRNESSILRSVLLDRKIQANFGHRSRKVSVLEAIILRMADNALKGDPKSATFLLNRYAAVVSGEPQPQHLSEDDRAVLDAFVQDMMQRKGAR